MTLKVVADSNRQLKNCWKQGMQAVKSKDKKLIKSKNMACSGSINIDECLKSECPNENRWDYGLDVNGNGIFVEVHPAHTSEVKTVLAKLSWLKTWFNRNCSGFSNLNKTYYWVASGRVDIPRTDRHYKLLAMAGITGPSKHLKLGLARES